MVRNRNEYIAWLKKEFNLDPAKDLEEDKNHDESTDIVAMNDKQRFSFSEDISKIQVEESKAEVK